MASNTKKTETKRLRKTHKAGKKRKRILDRTGSTKNETQMFGSALKR